MLYTVEIKKGINKNIKLEKGGVRFLHAKAFASITRFK